MLLFFLLSSSCRYAGPMILTCWTDVGTWSHILDMGTAVSPQKLKCCKTNVSFVCFSTWCDVGWMQRWLVTRWRQKDVRMSLVFHIGLRESKLFSVILDKVYCIFQVIKAESIAALAMAIAALVYSCFCAFLVCTHFRSRGTQYSSHILNQHHMQKEKTPCKFPYSWRSMCISSFFFPFLSVYSYSNCTKVPLLKVLLMPRSSSGYHLTGHCLSNFFHMNKMSKPFLSNSVYHCFHYMIRCRRLHFQSVRYSHRHYFE